MIQYVSGDILSDTADALVCPVNCEGLPGAGLAKLFDHKFPGEMDLYRAACRVGNLRPGGVACIGRVWCAATKKKWKDPSSLEWIRLCAAGIVWAAEGEKAQCVAVPALGCGLGGMNWEDVRTILETAFSPGEKVFKVYGR